MIRGSAAGRVVFVGTGIAGVTVSACVDGVTAAVLLGLAALVPIAWAVSPRPRPLATEALQLPPPPIDRVAALPPDEPVPFELVISSAANLTPAETRWS